MVEVDILNFGLQGPDATGQRVFLGGIASLQQDVQLLAGSLQRTFLSADGSAMLFDQLFVSGHLCGIQLQHFSDAVLERIAVSMGRVVQSEKDQPTHIEQEKGNNSPL